MRPGRMRLLSFLDVMTKSPSLHLMPDIFRGLILSPRVFENLEIFTLDQLIRQVVEI
jgi:hypothetical protein